MISRNRGLGIALSYANTFLSMISGLFLSSFMLRQLGDTDYGVYQTMSSFANYLVLLEFGTGTVMSRNLSAVRAQGNSKEEIEKHVSTIWSITAFLSLVILLVSGIFYLSIGTIYSGSLTPQQIADGKQMFVLITVFLIGSFLSHTLNGIVLAHEHYTYSSVMAIVKLVSRLVLLVCLIGQFKKAVIICAVDAAVNVLAVAYTFVYCRKKFAIKINFRHFDKVVLRSALPLCLALFLQTIVNQSNNIVGKFVLGVMAGPEEVALYSVGLYIFSVFSSLSVIPVSAYVPQVTKDVISGLGGLDLTKTLVQPCRMIVLVSGTILFGFFACGRPFVCIVYGEKYLLAWLMAIILTAPAFLNMSNAVVLNVLNAKNKRHVRSLMLMITTALNILMTIFGIKWFGIVAAAAATGISTLLQVLMMNIYYAKAIQIKVGYLFRNIFTGILPFQILGAATGFAVGAWIENIYVSFLCAGFAYVLVAFGGFWLFGKNEMEQKMIETLCRKITKRGTDK